MGTNYSFYSLIKFQKKFWTRLGQKSDKIRRFQPGLILKIALFLLIIPILVVMLPRVSLSFHQSSSMNV